MQILPWLNLKIIEFTGSSSSSSSSELLNTPYISFKIVSAELLPPTSSWIFLALILGAGAGESRTSSTENSCRGGLTTGVGGIVSMSVALVVCCRSWTDSLVVSFRSSSGGLVSSRSWSLGSVVCSWFLPFLFCSCSGPLSQTTQAAGWSRWALSSFWDWFWSPRQRTLGRGTSR